MLYGPLLDRGHTPHELAHYSRLELLVWLKILERHGVLQQGPQLERLAQEGTIEGRNVELMNRYLEERERLGDLTREDSEGQ